MEDVVFLRFFDIIIGSITLAIGLGIFFIPHVVGRIEKKLDKTFSTDKLEKMLNERKNVSQLLLNHPRAVGIILICCSLFLLVSGVVVF
jgi:hypothetical protein